MTNEDCPELKGNDLEDLLFEVVSDVLEQFAFMFTDPVEAQDFRPAASSMMQAQILFEGPFKGALSMYASSAFCVQLAANVLGVEPDDITQEHATDALKELVNVTCGELLLTIAGKQVIFNLAIPKIRRVPTEDALALLNETGVQPVLVDDQPMIVRVEIDAVP